MRLNKTEVNLRRLIASAPLQQNQSKLMHYVVTLRESLEQMGQEITPEGLPSVSKAKMNDYLEQIEAIASKSINPLVVKTNTMGPDIQVHQETVTVSAVKESLSKTDKDHILPSPGLRRRSVSIVEHGIQDATEADIMVPVKLDAKTYEHIGKHRKLQDSLTDELIELAEQLKESTLMMSHSLQNTEKLLDSSVKAVEHSLASTGRANARAMEIYSESSKTTCFTWLIIFAMTCIFFMVVLLIRVS